MKSKQAVRALLERMPDDVTLAEVIRWVDVLQLIGVGPAAASPTKAAVAVPTPSMGREPASTSST